jgi:Bacterial Ig-like domain
MGQYTLELDGVGGSFARFDGEDYEDPEALRAALEEEPSAVAEAAETLEGVQASAAEVTRQIERAIDLHRAAVEGRLFDRTSLNLEVDLLLELAGRLDKDGRYEEELRLVRSLHGLLLLLLRWIDLIRTLRKALGAADVVRDEASRAWLMHEFGSLHLCAGEPEKAATYLEQALALEQKLGLAGADCATRHNLDSAHRDRSVRGGPSRPRRRIGRLAGLAALLLVAAGGGAAIALWISDSDDGSAPKAAQTGTGTTTTTTTVSTPPTDTVSPTVSFDTPADGSTIGTATPTFAGSAGQAAGDDPTVLVTIADATGAVVPGFPQNVQIREGRWTLTAPNALADGTYSGTVRQGDAARNPPGTSSTGFAIDTTRPTLLLKCGSGFTLTPRCAVRTSESGVVHIDVSQAAVQDPCEQAVLLPDGLDVELKAGDTPEVTVTLPDSEQPSAFCLQASQTDAAGNRGVSDIQRLQPVG